MRALLVMGMFTASFVHAAGSDFAELRELATATDGARQLHIDAAAGALTVTGDDAASDVQVRATVIVPDVSDDKARRIIEESMQLRLARDGERIVLVSRFDAASGWFRDAPRIDLEVTMPSRLALSIDDSSGSLVVSGVDGEVDIVDGSGSITIDDLGDSLSIDDGSGSIRIENVGRDVNIVDGSGSIGIRHVGGKVTVDDGSGSIRVHDVAGDFVLVDDGSGSLRVSEVQGTVDDRS